MILELVGGHSCQIDEIDFQRFSCFQWHISASSYPATWIVIGKRREKVFLHRLVAGAAPWEIVDHISGDTLDCRRANLRLCTRYENLLNSKKMAGKSSRFKGVFWNKKNRKWRVKIAHKGIRYEVGSFAVEEDAARAYDAAALEHFGQFARLNFPRSTPLFAGARA